MMRRLMLSILGSGLILAGPACRHFGRPPAGCNQCPPSRGGDRFLDDPVPPGGGIPPPSVPTTPDVPSVLPDSRSSFRYGDIGPSPGSWVPVTPGAPNRVLPPKSSKEPLYAEAPKPAPPADRPEERKPRTFLEEPVRPDTGPPASVPDSPPGDSRGSAYLQEPVAPTAVPRTAVGLPGYTVVPGRDGVAVGRRPSLEGFDWLKKNGFRTMVYLHAPGVDPSATRDLATQRGLRFVPIAVSPATLKAAFDEFTTTINDRSTRPVYVADDDGLRAGGLFYLLFRTADLLGDDAARLRAGPLGTLDTATEEQKQFWVAIQDYLAKR